MGEEEGVVVFLFGGGLGGRGGTVAEAEAGGEVEEAVGVQVDGTEVWGWHFVGFGM